MRVTAAEFRKLVSPPADAEPAPRPRPRLGDGGECQRCHKPLKWPAVDGLGPVCRRIIAAEQAAATDPTAEEPTP